MHRVPWMQCNSAPWICLYADVTKHSGNARRSNWFEQVPILICHWKEKKNAGNFIFQIRYPDIPTYFWEGIIFHGIDISKQDLTRIIIYLCQGWEINFKIGNYLIRKKHLASILVMTTPSLTASKNTQLRIQQKLPRDQVFLKVLWACRSLYGQWYLCIITQDSLGANASCIKIVSLY